MRDKELQHSQNHRVVTYDFWWLRSNDDMSTVYFFIVNKAFQGLLDMPGALSDVLARCGQRLPGSGLLGTGLLDGLVAADWDESVLLAVLWQQRAPQNRKLIFKGFDVPKSQGCMCWISFGL